MFSSKLEVVCICAFGCVFALNITINNFGLGYIGIAVISPSGLTSHCQRSFPSMAMCVLVCILLWGAEFVLGLMVIGIRCAAAFTMAVIMVAGKADHKSIMWFSVESQALLYCCAVLCTCVSRRSGREGTQRIWHCCVHVHTC